MALTLVFLVMEPNCFVGASLLAISGAIASKRAPTPNGIPLGGQGAETMIEFSTEKGLK
jgi:hypothetical protein